MEDKMKNFWILILLLILAGCSPPTAKFIRDQRMDPVTYIDIAPMIEVEERLTKAFAEQVDWDLYDDEIITSSISAIKGEFEWLSRKAQIQGSLSYYDTVVANEKVDYFWSQARKELDEIVTNGEVDTDTSLIYYYVRRDIEKALLEWKMTVKTAEASIDAKIGQYDVEQIKKAFNMLKPFLATIL
jgi:hypothetical protein